MGRKSNIKKITEIFESNGITLQRHIEKYDNGHEQDFGMCWLNKDGKYIIHKGLELHYKFLLKNNIDILESNNLGFSTISQKWYGWSHRAMYGFGIGSQVKKGDCAYSPSSKEDWIEEHVNFYTNEVDPSNHEATRTQEVKSDCEFEEYGEKKIGIYLCNTITFTNGRKPCGLGHYTEYPEKFDGRGEWTAKTLDDAKQMAIDFANDVA